jgi:predicted dehydrogenase
MNVYVGQHLSTWRPGRDHRSSASAVRGSGGVLRDLSHELDTVRWLVGPWRRLTAIGGCFGALEIESDDAFGLLLETERCPLVSVQMNYLDHIGARTLGMILEEQTLHADLVAGTLRTPAGVESFAVERDETYRAMHLSILSGETGACDAVEGLAAVDTIDAAERGAFGAWIRPRP